VTYSRRPTSPISLGVMADNAMPIGESPVGEGADAVHISTVLGSWNGPIGVAWATPPATP
jgi:hypothetical protein